MYDGSDFPDHPAEDWTPSDLPGMDPAVGDAIGDADDVSHAVSDELGGLPPVEPDMNPGVVGALGSVDDLIGGTNDLVGDIQHDIETGSPDIHSDLPPGTAPPAPLFTPHFDIVDHPFDPSNPRFDPVDGHDTQDPGSSSYGLWGGPNNPTGNGPIKNPDGTEERP